MQKSLKEIYGLVSENLLLAKCKLISNLSLNLELFLGSNVREVEELLKESEINLQEMKISIQDLKKEITDVKKERAENKSVANDDKSSAMTKSR